MTRPASDPACSIPGQGPETLSPAGLVPTLYRVSCRIWDGVRARPAGWRARSPGADVTETGCGAGRDENWKTGYMRSNCNSTMWHLARLRFQPRGFPTGDRRTACWTVAIETESPRC